MADPNLISQAIGNLLDNAVKFSPAGGLITVRAGASDGSLLITVADQGIGIPPDKLELVFERFYQVHGGLNRIFSKIRGSTALPDFCRSHSTACQ